MLSAPSTGSEPQVDWGEALDVPSFYGREEELALLSGWVGEQRCRVVSVLGMGGIGKSALAVSLMHRVASHFEVVLWRSLRDAPACDVLLEDCLQVLAPEPLREVPISLERRLGLLLEHLRDQRALLALDNLEVLLAEGEGTGRMRAGYEDYGRLLRQVAETEHQSCLLLTSREKPRDLVALEGSRMPVRSLRLDGLDAVASEQLLAKKEVVGPPHDRERLVEAYAGNPLALKIVAQTIVELFDGEIAPFLEQGEVVFGGVRELLAEQFARLSAAEQTVLLWLAILREPVSIEELQTMLVTPLSRAQVLEAVEALRRRSLIERGQRQGCFTLQSVVLEYATAQLIAEAASEIEQGRLASASFDGGMRMWEQPGVQPETFVRMLTGHTNWVTGLGFAPDGRTLASGSFDRTVKLWEVESGRCLQTLAGHTDPVFGIAWSPDGRLLASCGWDQMIWLWDVERGSYRTALHGHTAPVYDLAFTPDGHSLLSGSEDRTLRLWDVERGQCLHIMQGYAVSLCDVAWSPDGSRLASVGFDLLVTFWDVNGGTPPRGLRGHNWIVYGVAWSLDGWLLASSGYDNAIRVWDASTGAGVQLLRDPDHVATIFQGVAWSPNGKFLATGSYHHGVHVWEVTTGTRRWVGRGQPTRIRRVAWSPDGSRLASSGDDGSVCLWEVSDGRLRASLQGHRGRVMSVAWSPDATRLASGGGDRGSGELVVWEVQSGERLYTLNEPSAMINALAWGPTGSVLVSGGGDGMLRWWDLQHGECVRVRMAHQGAVQSLKLSPDGRRLASCGDDGAIQVWDMESGELRRTLRRDRPYERLDISGVKGLTDAQRATLRALGAIEKRAVPLTAE